MHKKRLSIAVLSGLIVETLNKIVPLVIMFVAQKRLGMESFGFALFGVSIIEMAVNFVNLGF